MSGPHGGAAGPLRAPACAWSALLRGGQGIGAHSCLADPGPGRHAACACQAQRLRRPAQARPPLTPPRSPPAPQILLRRRQHHRAQLQRHGGGWLHQRLLLLPASVCPGRVSWRAAGRPGAAAHGILALAMQAPARLVTLHLLPCQPASHANHGGQGIAPLPPPQKNLSCRPVPCTPSSRAAACTAASLCAATHRWTPTRTHTEWPSAPPAWSSATSSTPRTAPTGSTPSSPMCEWGWGQGHRVGCAGAGWRNCPCGVACARQDPSSPSLAPLHGKPAQGLMPPGTGCGGAIHLSSRGVQQLCPA